MNLYLDRMSHQEEEANVLLEAWALQKDIKEMGEALQEWSKKIVLTEYKQIYDTLDDKIGEASKKIAIIVTEAEKTLIEEKKNQKDKSEGLNVPKNEGQEAENLASHNRDPELRFQELEEKVRQYEKDIEALKKERALMKKEMNSMLIKIASLSLENKTLSQRADDSSQKLSEVKKELSEVKSEANQAVRDQEIIILGDFAYQFQNLLGRVFEEDYGLTIAQVEELVQSNSSLKGVALLKKHGLTKSESLKQLDHSLYSIKDARNLVGHKAIKTNMKFSFEDIRNLAQKHFLSSKIGPIVDAWQLLMNSGEMFDEKTWVLDFPF